MEEVEDYLKYIKFDEKGLVPAVLQEVGTGEVLMVAYMNQESLKRTIETGKACFWSRSRQELWLKGETSGNYQLVENIKIDCDGDTLLLEVKPEGPACHTGKKTCFYRELSGEEIKDKNEVEQNETKGKQQEEFKEKMSFLYRLYEIIRERKENPPPESYTAYLFREGVDKICKKIGEESAEVIIGAKNEDNSEIIYETADLIYHLFVLLVLYKIPFENIIEELEKRHK